jgi:type IV fimbrial biogenesis protein FimT
MKSLVNRGEPPSSLISSGDTPEVIVRSVSGFSLVELLVVIAIMGIVMTVSTLSFNSWQVKNNIESQTRELFTDLSEARTKAFTQKKVYGIVLQPTSYVMKTYSSEVEYISNPAAAANGTVVASKSLKYSLATNTGADISNTSVVFDTSGFTTSWFIGLSVLVGPATVPASLNCVVVSTARSNMGKINGTNCDYR